MLEGALGYNVDSHALTTAVTANRKANGKEMELKASWAEMSGAQHGSLQRQLANWALSLSPLLLLR